MKDMIWKEDNATPNEDVSATPIKSKVSESKVSEREVEVKVRVTIPPLINVKGFNFRRLLNFNKVKNQE